MSARDGLRATGVVVRYGGLLAVDGVDVHAPRGRITGLIGPNGAGKTSLFDACSGFVTPSAGTVTLDSVDITGASPAGRARLGLGRTFQQMELFASLSVRENVALAVESSLIDSDDPLVLFGLRRRQRAMRDVVDERTAALLARAGLDDVASRRASEVSTGHGRRIELARALARNPAVLLLDEPSSGLDAAETKRFGTLLRTLVAGGETGVLLVEHDLSLVLNVCEWIHVIDSGKPLFAGPPADVRASELVRASYLGREAG